MGLFKLFLGDLGDVLAPKELYWLPWIVKFYGMTDFVKL